MIRQVRLVEVVSVGGVVMDKTVFGFGRHPQALAEDQHPVTTAKAAQNRLRIIVDELLRGNELEKVECRYPIDADAFDRIPLGATPDDIARCAVAQDELAARCTSADRHSVCLCKAPGGCASGTDGSGAPRITPVGVSVGVLDADADGAADRMRMAEGAVTILCGEQEGSAAINVPIDLANSFWTPAGNQRFPAFGGFDVLGPAIVVVPAAGLPAGTACGIGFAPEVVDKDGIRVCAPPDGDPDGSCAPGDTSLVSFTVEPLQLAASATENGQSRTADIVISANTPIAAASLGGISVIEAPATSYTQFEATLSSPTTIRIRWTAPGGLAAATRYTLTIPTTVTDAFGRGAPASLERVFTTAAAVAAKN